ncbi:unnamed protein product [Polarella glacialis]|nr:unnamed protein product [Polarella glacialis]
MRRQLVEDFGLKPRDIVALFSKDERRGFRFNVRSGAALLSLGRDGPAVIVEKRAAWILPRTGTIATISTKVQKKYMEVVALAVGSPSPKADGNDFGSELEDHGKDSVHFSLAVTEALLVMFLDRLTTMLHPSSAEATNLLRELTPTRSRQVDVTALQLETLRRTKQRLDYMLSQAKSFQQALLEALEDEDDLEELASSVGPTTEEWELCFEYYSQSAEELVLEATRLIEDLEDLERSIALRLSSRRLELEKIQLFLELLGLGLGTGALLTGAFGMNLPSGFESKRPAFFWKAFASILLACISVSTSLRYLVLRRLRRKGVGQLGRSAA